MSSETTTSGRHTGWFVFAGGLAIGGTLAVALTYAYASTILESRTHSKRNKPNQRHALHGASGLTCPELLRAYYIASTRASRGVICPACA